MKYKKLPLMLLLLPTFSLADIIVQERAQILSNASIVIHDGSINNSGILTGGSIKMNGSDSSSIGGTGQTELEKLVINKQSADVEVLVEGTVSVSDTLSVLSNLNLNGNKVNLGTTGTLVESTGNVMGDSGTISATRTLKKPNAENVAGLGAYIAVGTTNTFTALSSKVVWLQLMSDGVDKWYVVGLYF